MRRIAAMWYKSNLELILNMSGANGGRVRKIIEPTDNEIIKYFLTAKNEDKGYTWVDVLNERKITVVSKTKNSTILSVESLRRPGSNNKTIYKSFNAFQTDAPKVWEKLKELKEPYRNYVLIYDKLSCEEAKTRKKTRGSRGRALTKLHPSS